MLLNSLLLPQKRNLRGGGARGALEIAFVNKSRGSKGHKELKQTSVPAREIPEKAQHSPVSCVSGATKEAAGRGVWGAGEMGCFASLDQLPLLLTTLLRGATLKTCYS